MRQPPAAAVLAVALISGAQARASTVFVPVSNAPRAPSPASPPGPIVPATEGAVPPPAVPVQAGAAAKISADSGADLSALRIAMQAEVRGLLVDDPEADAREIAMAQQEVASAGAQLDRPQFLLVVDRAPSVQELRVVLADPSGAWSVVGGTHVSTGKPGRKEHFKTPTGVFLNTADILGYRAQGTYNQNHIRGLGLKGMRVWDFGWQNTEDWRTGGMTMNIRLEMHATDPSVLERRIGRPDSEGCVRIPATLNRFLDKHGVIDRQLEEAAATDRRFDALLPADRDPTPLAGDALVVVDSGAGS
jgi:hypothetical protein